MAVVYGYAAHATVVTPPAAGAPAPGYDGDYPGVASAAVEAGLDDLTPPPGGGGGVGPAVALYLPGPGGDINVAPRGGVREAVAAGRALAAAVLAAVATTATDGNGGDDDGGDIGDGGSSHGGGSRARAGVGSGRPLPATAATAWAAVPLPFAATVPAATLRRQARRGGVDGAGAAAALRALPPGAAASAATYPLGVGVWVLGGLRLALLGGEPTVGYATALTGRGGGGWGTATATAAAMATTPAGLSVAATVAVDWVVGYVDDVVGYVGDPAVLAGGGREGSLRAAVYYGLPERWAPTAPAVLIDAVRGMAAALGDGGGRGAGGAEGGADGQRGARRQDADRGARIGIGAADREH